MRRFVLLLPLALAACATEQESCINSVNREMRVLNNLIDETRMNVTRGYALEEKSEVVVIEKMCRTPQKDGTVVVTPCNETITNTIEVPKAIDLNAEQAKLDSLIQRRNAMEPNVSTAIQQCIAQYPET